MFSARVESERAGLRKGTEIALKVRRVDGDGLSLDIDSARFWRESEILSLSQHPSIVTVFDRGQLGEYLFIAMELAGDGDLASHITGAKLSGRRGIGVEETAKVLRDVASGLDAAHSEGFIHRDIKPGNILVRSANREPRYAISDFGIAFVVGRPRDTPYGQDPGTLPYLPPERLKGMAGTAQSDIYMLGCTAIEMLTGSTPFLNLSFGQRLSSDPEKDETRVREWLGDFPDLVGPVLRAMAYSPEDRYPAARGFAAAFAEAAGVDLPATTMRNAVGAEPGAGSTASFGISQEGSTPGPPADKRKVIGFPPKLLIWASVILLALAFLFGLDRARRDSASTLTGDLTLVVERNGWSDLKESQDGEKVSTLVTRILEQFREDGFDGDVFVVGGDGELDSPTDIQGAIDTTAFSSEDPDSMLREAVLSASPGSEIVLVGGGYDFEVSRENLTLIDERELAVSYIATSPGEFNTEIDPELSFRSLVERSSGNYVDATKVGVVESVQEVDPA